MITETWHEADASWNDGGTTYFVIVYPRGVRHSLDLAEISNDLTYEEDDYDIASRFRFRNRDYAVDYASELCRKYGLKLQCNKKIALLD